jgi:flagellar FliL protein
MTDESHGSDDASLDEPKGGKKKLIIVAAAVLLLGGGGAGAYFTGALDGLLGKKSEEGGEHAAEGEHAAAEGGHEAPKKDEDHGGGDHGGEGGHGGASAFVPIPDMLVSLNTDDGTSRYLRLKVQLELANPADSGAIEAIMPRVVDQFQTYLREMRVEDLRGSKGLWRLQMELLSRVNAAAAPIQVKDVLFQEILVQ